MNNDFEVLEGRIRLYIAEELSAMIKAGAKFPSPFWAYHGNMAHAAMHVMRTIASVDETRELENACAEAEADEFYAKLNDQLVDGDDRGEVRDWGNPAADKH